MGGTVTGLTPTVKAFTVSVLTAKYTASREDIRPLIKTKIQAA